jgi:hypothetical protein
MFDTASGELRGRLDFSAVGPVVQANGSAQYSAGKLGD